MDEGSAQPSSATPAASMRRSGVRLDGPFWRRFATAGLALAAVVAALIAVLLQSFPSTGGPGAPSWMVLVHGAFVLPPLFLFAVVWAALDGTPRRVRAGAALSPLGLALWMGYELAAVWFVTPDARGAGVELAIDAIVEAGVLAYLIGGLHEHRRLSAEAEHDALTGLLNRAGAARAWLDARDGEPMVLAVIDLNELKAVNDRNGHEAGDALLRACAGALSAAAAAAGGWAARWGGDEFLVALPTDDEVAARLHVDAAAAGVVGRVGELPVWAVGVARAFRGVPLRDAVTRADARMYRHKAELYGRFEQAAGAAAMTRRSRMRGAPS